PHYNQLLDKSINLNFLISPLSIVVLLLAVLLLGVIAGFYPAFYLTNFRPVSALQKLMTHRSKESLRHFLVVGQLLIAVVLIASTITVFRQMNYLMNKPLGFEKDQLIKIDQLPVENERIDAFQQEIEKIDGVLGVAISSFPMDNIRSGASIRTMDNAQGWVNMTHYDVDENYVSTLGMTLLSGRNLTRADGMEKDTTRLNIVLNRAGAASLGWSPEEAINKRVAFSEDANASWMIVGIVEDFNFTSLHDPVDEFILSHEALFTEFPMRSATIRFDPRKMQSSLEELGEIWASFAPDRAFDFDFVDQSMAQYYESEKLTSKMFVLFSGLSLFICCLGLFGLMGYVVEQRAKEVGIRKVMGAKVSSIIMLLSKDYIRLVLISSLIAIPIAWWGLNQWLDEFAYRLDNSLWVFLLAGLAVTIVSWVTVAFYAYQAAKANPVTSLRTE
ncbi:MAG: FtsX-like permease family protein, partial [Bacteroidota bacterium]